MLTVLAFGSADNTLIVPDITIKLHPIIVNYYLILLM